MRFLLILLIALSFALVWQSSAIADISSAESCIAAEKAEGKQEEADEDEEPDCD